MGTVPRLGLALMAATLVAAGCSAPDHNRVPPPSTTAGPQACPPADMEVRLVRADVPSRFLVRAVVSRTVAGRHHVVRAAIVGDPVVPSVTPAALAPWLGAVVDQLADQVPGLMPQPGPQSAALLPDIPATGMLVGYQGAKRLGATFEAFCGGAYRGRGHVSSWGYDTVGLLDCALGAPRESLGALAAAYCQPKSRGRS